MTQGLKQSLLSGLMACLLTNGWSQQNDKIVIQTKKIVSDIQPTMWGVFFEDINMGADGGIYAELVKNRSFEFQRPLMGWTPLGDRVPEGSILVQNRQGANLSNPRYIRVARNKATGRSGLSNEGFKGMGIKKNLPYDFSILYRQQDPGVRLRVELVNTAGKTIGSTVLSPDKTGADWQKASVRFMATDSTMKGRLNVWFEGEGTIDLDMISLFPTDTWKGRPGGMRADMIQLLADMKPGFIRFPGGCIVEGYDLSQRYQWKKTIGPVEDRQLLINRWNFEFAHRPAPDYFQTFGLGFFEYFQLAEDIGAAPLPILNCGMACQFNTAEVVPMDQLDPYVQDALDLIEFANGDATTKWGKIRTDLGHQAPFHLKMMGVGNENWGPQYLERLQVFTKAIKAKYPDFKIVNSSGTDPEGDRFHLLDTALRTAKADIIDEHYYRRPEWFLANAGRYDQYPRNGVKIFGGEYAAQSDKIVSVDNRNNWQTAIAEAAFMTGMERNAAVVHMASYAPLFAHADGWQWTPDLIWVNNLQSYGTANYQVQKLYSTNRGTHVVPALLNGKPLEGADSLYATAALDKNTNELIVKIVNAAAVPRKKNILLDGVKKTGASAQQITLQSDQMAVVNSFDAPATISPKETAVALKGNQLNLDLAPYSFTVIRVPLER